MKIYNFKENFNNDYKFYTRFNQLCMKLLNFNENLKYTKTDNNKLIDFLNENKKYIKYFTFPLISNNNNIYFIGFIDILKIIKNTLNMIIFIEDEINDDFLYIYQGFLYYSIKDGLIRIPNNKILNNIDITFINKKSLEIRKLKNKSKIELINIFLKTKFNNLKDNDKYSFLIKDVK